MTGFIFAIFVVSDKINTTFVGLQAQRGVGLVDAGTQRGVSGQDQFDKLVTVLEKRLAWRPRRFRLCRRAPRELAVPRSFSPVGPCLSALP